MTEPYTLLTVCTGNICRSPAMERLLAHHLDEEGIRVHSGGTYAHDGEDMQPPMRERVSDYGADARNFVADQLTPQMVRDSDLILTATRVHVEDILADVPEAEDRTFTVREVGRLLSSVDTDQITEAVGQGATVADRLAALVPLVAQQRSGAASAGSEDDVVDPYMLPSDVYDESFRQLREPIEALVEAVRPS
ncbi:arsenate reductase/protein-tyrosine-phosphatase family protein [Nesterenkonia cremea]|uniref:Low molecular weight phosphatase family protein n=1 Tax=Nesterenkonia cremea TaxID=1882340 RepID=A0A917ASY8_9MICC|nr:low molecular weight phosphatase family protein [Nesterenkonia cremea]GGE71781.1 low molecular weight phosphatase family protein [Nesterenkonia cremea]